MKIAFIGTGVMGAPMASHLAEAGHEVYVYNRTASKARALEPLCTFARSIADCVKDVDIVFSIVGFVKDVEEIYLADNGIIANVKPGTVVCDMTTSSPSLAEKIYLFAREYGVFALDAPVTGGDKGAKEATLSIMVGGDKEIFDKVLPLFQLMGKTVNYMGSSGAGQNMKLANQIAIAATISGIAEAISFAKIKNLNLETMLDVIVNGSAASWQAANNGKKMISSDFNPGFFIKHFIKDLNLAQEACEDLSIPLAKKVLDIYQELAERGLGDLGTQAIIEYYKK